MENSNLPHEETFNIRKDKVLIKDLLNSSAPTKPPRYSNRIVPHTSTASPVKMSSFKFQSIFLGLHYHTMLRSPCEIAVEVSKKMTDDMRNPIDGKRVKNTTDKKTGTK